MVIQNSKNMNLIFQTFRTGVSQLFDSNLLHLASFSKSASSQTTSADQQMFHEFPPLFIRLTFIHTYPYFNYSVCDRPADGNCQENLVASQENCFSL